MAVEIGRLYKKTITRDLSGNIINLQDEADGGWIIRNRQVVNQEKYQQLLRKEEDRRIAAQASAQPISAPVEVVAKRTGPSESDVRIQKLEDKMDLILKALNKKK